MNGTRTACIVFSLFSTSLTMGGLVHGQALEDNNYQSELRPGLHFHSEPGTGSLIAKAAREGGSVVISENGVSTGEVQESSVEKYAVKEGDTLWDICTRYFGDPYAWPRVWSYNVNVTNPHWIYPGDLLWLVPPVTEPMFMPQDDISTSSIVKQMSQKSIFVKNTSFIDAELLKESGVIVGAQKEIIMLSQHDEAYAEFENAQDVNSGNVFAAYKILRSVDSIEDPGSEIGKLVEILGTVRVVHFDKKQGIARVVIAESFKPISRGTMIGPVKRQFNVISKVVNKKDLKGHIIAHLDLTVLSSAGSVVFVDHGEEQGIIAGNRFFVIAKRDRLRESNDEPDDRDGYPFEVLAELRVIEVRPNTSTCMITSSIKELEIGAVVEMVKGY